MRHGDRDRRLSIIRTIRPDRSLSDDSYFPNHVWVDPSIEGWYHIQHLGEHMVFRYIYTLFAVSNEQQMSKVLQAYLGQAYSPERQWTSRLRSRSGHKAFEDPTPCAAFTMRDMKTRSQMTSFIIKYGHSRIAKWQEKLRANPPIYHVEVAVSAGSKTSNFVMTSSQLERVSICSNLATRM